MQKLMKRLHKNEKGFTLVELMVVVVIIGILVAIAIPLYNNVSAAAAARANEANLRIIDGAIQMYGASTNPPTDTSTLAIASDAAPGVLADYLQAWPVHAGFNYSVAAGKAVGTAK